MGLITTENILFILIMGIPAYFISRFVAQKLVSKEPKRQILTWLLTLLLMPVLDGLAVMTFFSILFYEPNCAFEKQKWEVEMAENRRCMADNLVSSQILIGKDSTKVKEIIGEPTWARQISTDTLLWEYDLGMGSRGLGWAFHSVSVVFESNRAISVTHNVVPD